MTVLRQLASFGMIGIVATLAHVTAAYLLRVQFAADPYLANLVGFLLALSISFAGNARFTFYYKGAISSALVRFLALSSVSLVITTLVMAWVVRNHLPMEIYVLVVVMTVPPVTYLLARFWVFVPRHRMDSAREGR